MTRHILKISKYRPSILQGKLEFGGAHIALEHPRERLIMQALVFALAAVFCCYLYFVTSSVLNVIASKEAEQAITKLQSSIAESEQQYFELSQLATPDKGASLGLVPIKQSHFVYRENTSPDTIARSGN